jgi:prepilin-type N-terminal cleavage/methylation domain-containing protein
MYGEETTMKSITSSLNPIRTLAQSSRGYTLVELMIVVAIIGILSAIAIPQFSGATAKAKEASTKGNLGVMRTTLAIYNADTEGGYPVGQFNVDLAPLLTGKYISSIPYTILPTTSNNVGHAKSNVICSTYGTYNAGAAGTGYNFTCPGGMTAGVNPMGSSLFKIMAQTVESGNEAGGWAYDGVIGSSTFGQVAVLCQHSDVRGTAWWNQ